MKNPKSKNSILIVGPVYLEDWLLVPEKENINFGSQYWATRSEFDILGGGAFNVSNHLSNLSTELLFLSVCGKDDFGMKIKNILVNMGDVFESNLIFVPGKTSTSINIISSISGEPIYITTGDAHEQITIEKLHPYLDNFDIVVFSAFAKMEKLHMGLLEYLELRKDKPRIFIDTGKLNRDQANGILQLMQYINLLKLNQSEILSLFNTEELDRAIELCRESYVDLNLVVTLGKNGCIVVPSKGNCQKIRNPKTITNIASSVGAGDAFFAKLIQGFCNEENLYQSAMNATNFAISFLESKGDKLGGYYVK